MYKVGSRGFLCPETTTYRPSLTSCNAPSVCAGTELRDRPPEPKPNSIGTSVIKALRSPRPSLWPQSSNSHHRHEHGECSTPNASQLPSRRDADAGLYIERSSLLLNGRCASWCLVPARQTVSVGQPFFREPRNPINTVAYVFVHPANDCSE
jgi:hypothetical protein